MKWWSVVCLVGFVVGLDPAADLSEDHLVAKFEQEDPDKAPVGFAAAADAELAQEDQLNENLEQFDPSRAAFEKEWNRLQKPYAHKKRAWVWPMRRPPGHPSRRNERAGRNRRRGRRSFADDAFVDEEDEFENQRFIEGDAEFAQEDQLNENLEEDQLNGNLEEFGEDASRAEIEKEWNRLLKRSRQAQRPWRWPPRRSPTGFRRNPAGRNRRRARRSKSFANDAFVDEEDDIPEMMTSENQPFIEGDNLENSTFLEGDNSRAAFEKEWDRIQDRYDTQGKRVWSWPPQRRNNPLRRNRRRVGRKGNRRRGRRSFADDAFVEDGEGDVDFVDEDGDVDFVDEEY